MRSTPLLVLCFLVPYTALGFPKGICEGTWEEARAAALTVPHGLALPRARAEADPLAGHLSELTVGTDHFAPSAPSTARAFTTVAMSRSYFRFMLG